MALAHRSHREACLLIKQRTTTPVTALIPLPPPKSAPPPHTRLGNCTKCSTLERFSLSTFKLFSHILLDLCFHFQSGLGLDFGLCLRLRLWLCFFLGSLFCSLFWGIQVAARFVFFYLASPSAKLPKLFNWLTFAVFAWLLWQICLGKSEATAKQGSVEDMNAKIKGEFRRGIGFL